MSRLRWVVAFEHSEHATSVAMLVLGSLIPSVYLV